MKELAKEIAKAIIEDAESESVIINVVGIINPFTEFTYTYHSSLDEDWCYSITAN